MSWIVLVENYGVVKEPIAYGVFRSKEEADKYVSPDKHIVHTDTKIKTVFLNDFKNKYENTP